MSETLIGNYINGNYKVAIFTDGTKIRVSSCDEFVPKFAENIDIKICNYCDMNCKWCHESSTVFGTFGNLKDSLFDTLHPFQEIAIGGGNALAHPDLISFLEKMKQKRVICNITVNQNHFIKHQELIRSLVDDGLIWGLGVSLINSLDVEFIKLLKSYNNAVVHVISGLIDEPKLKPLYDNNIKLLILGYKTFGRGSEYYEFHKTEIDNNVFWLKSNIKELLNKFSIISFDNLSLEQLSIKELLSKDEWEKFYMGNDGTSTFYIDLVNQTFSKNSTSSYEERFPLKNNVDDMFEQILKFNS